VFLPVATAMSDKAPFPDLPFNVFSKLMIYKFLEIHKNSSDSPVEVWWSPARHARVEFSLIVR